MKYDFKPLLNAINNFIEKADDELKDTLDSAGYIEPEETVKEIAKIENRIADTLKQQTDYIIDSAEEAVDLETFAKEVWSKVKLNDDSAKKLGSVFVEEFETYMPNLVTHYAKKIDPELTVNQISKRTTAWVESWSEELGELMKLDSHKEIERILTTGLKSGQGIGEFTQAIIDSKIRAEPQESKSKEKKDNKSKDKKWKERHKREEERRAHYKEYQRAHKVAVTEVLRAHNVAQQESFMQSPAVEQKMWRHTGAYKNEPRQNHVDIDGQIVDKNESFELIGRDGKTYRPMYPMDVILPAEESIYCHCLSQPVVSKEILGLSLEERQRLQQEAIDKMDDEWEKELDAKNKAKAGIEG